VQKDLAASLRLIAENGADEFYQGSIAEKIVADMQNNRGIINIMILISLIIIQILMSLYARQ
jgi:gamma-glutamyltranspeptidase/glutathione hydrolase